MSCVKLWLKNISKKKLEILKQFDNVVIYDLRGKSYSQICRAIFRNYYKNDVILVGKTKYELPIPKVRKNFTKNNIHSLLNSVTTATFSFRLKKPIRINNTEIKTYYGDTFKLWSRSHLLKTHMWDVDELFWLTFKTDDVTKVKAWGISLDELDKYPDHCQRLMKAKLSYPIYVYGNSVVDGLSGTMTFGAVFKVVTGVSAGAGVTTGVSALAGGLEISSAGTGINSPGATDGVAVTAPAGVEFG